MNPTTRKLATLMGSASLFTLANALSAHAQQVAQAQMAQASTEVPEQVLVTGSLIHGAVAVGVPVTNLSVQDFKQTGAQTTADLFKTIPQANVSPGAVGTNSGGHLERETRVNIRGLDQTGPRSLLMVDGMRFPPQADGICAIDPSIIPSLALDRIDILADGASATYGSDAIAGVINVILKRGYDGAVTQFVYSNSQAGGAHYQAAQLWGRTWDGGDITISYEWTDEQPVYGNANSHYTGDFSPWGLDNRNSIGGSMPGTISTGAPANAANALSATLGTNCTNCFAIPKGTGVAFTPGVTGLGPTAPSSAATLTWNGATFVNSSGTAGVGAGPGTANVFDTLKSGYEVAPQQRNAATLTVDQRLTKNISFFGEAFYTNRRVETLVAAGAQPVTNDELSGIAVPTFNPYYPTGAGVPTNLRVSYDTAIEIPSFVNAIEVSDRYAFGLNIDLPGDWHGQIYMSESFDTNKYNHLGTVNKNLVSAALGWTVASTGGSGTVPGIATFTKPAAVPYLNLFCDARVINCNATATRTYITGQRYLYDQFWINEKGIKLDGPVIDVPAGQIKMAVGGTYNSNAVNFARKNTTAGAPLQADSFDAEPYQVWAGFAQVNIPIVGDNNQFPLFRKLDLEASWRHDQYSGTLKGATSNPKLGFTWELSEDLGASVKGSWGTSFRFANAGEYSVVASDAVQDYGFAGSSFGQISIPCSGGAPTAGTVAAAEVAAGFACNSQPTGMSWAGGPQATLRSYINANTGVVTAREGGTALAPEKSANYSLGFDFAPQTFLRGLDLQATWYSVKINGTLLGFNNQGSSSFGDPNQRFHWIVPSDLGCPVAQNANPSLCAPFEKMAAAVLLDPNSLQPLSALTSIFWLNDGGTVGTGFVHVTGIDWQASYDVDLGDLGAWNAGIAGTYYLHRYETTVSGATIIDDFHQDRAPNNGVAMNGVETLPRMRYRARLGWSDGQWNVTAFMDYQSHFFHTQTAPPNVNHACASLGSTIPAAAGAPLFDCAITGYTNLEPSWYSFDLSFGYNTGEKPANDYLKDIGIQVVVGNIMDKHPPFEYGPSNAGRAVAAFDILKSDLGRTYTISLTKTW